MADKLPQTEEQAERRREASKLARQVEANDVRWLMSSAQGRRVVRKWLAKAGVHRGTFVPGAPDVSAFNEGLRSFGLQLLDEVTRFAPDEYLQLLAEGKKADPQ